MRRPLCLSLLGLVAILALGCEPGPPAPPYKALGPVHRGIVDDEPKALGDSFGFVRIKAIEGYADQFNPTDILVPLINAPKRGEEVLFQMYEFSYMRIGTGDHTHYGGANLLVREPIKKIGGDDGIRTSNSETSY